MRGQWSNDQGKQQMSTPPRPSPGLPSLRSSAPYDPPLPYNMALSLTEFARARFVSQRVPHLYILLLYDFAIIVHFVIPGEREGHGYGSLCAHTKNATTIFLVIENDLSTAFTKPLPQTSLCKNDPHSKTPSTFVPPPKKLQCSSKVVNAYI